MKSRLPGHKFLFTSVFRKLLLMAIVLALAWFFYKGKRVVSRPYSIGQVVDSLNGVKVYYNGPVSHVSGRSLTRDQYNLGLRYQCVEFVKRYYYEHLNHKMPYTYGHATDFFDRTTKDGELNRKRNLIQFTNPGRSRPQPDDIIIFKGTTYNKYGHVAIVSAVTDHHLEIIQQNPGPLGKSRARLQLERTGDRWKIKNDRVLGRLRIK